jgi:Cytochrome c/c1 heme lyase
MGSGNSKVVTSTSNAVLDQKGNVARNPEQESTSSSTTASVEDPKNKTATSSSSRNDGCPMHRGDGTYSYDWRAMLRAGFPHGPGGSKPLTEEQARAKVGTTMSESSPLVVVAAQEPRGGCPVKQSAAAVAQEQEAGGCPDQRQKQPEYNVYAQPLDPTNNMPSNPNQLPAPTQSTPLSTERVASTIPKVRGHCCGTERL